MSRATFPEETEDDFEAIPETERAPKEMMDKFLEFMGELSNVQEKLTDNEYKSIADSASAVYQSAIDYRHKKAGEILKAGDLLSTIANQAIDAVVCKIVRDVPWADLTVNSLLTYVADECPGLKVGMLNKQNIKAVLDREVKMLIAQGREDPAKNRTMTGVKRKRVKL